MNRILHEAKSRLFWRDVSVEVMATFILMSVQCSVPLSWGDKGQAPTVFGSIVQQGLGMGFVVSATTWTFGDFGGCHMNPAVTCSMVVARQLSIFKVLSDHTTFHRLMAYEIHGRRNGIF